MDLSHANDTWQDSIFRACWGKNPCLRLYEIQFPCSNQVIGCPTWRL